MINKKNVVGGVLLISCFLLAGAFADEQNVDISVPAGTMVNFSRTVIPAGSGFVQVINGNPSNPPTGVANATNGQFSGGDVYAVARQAPMVGQPIAGMVGDFNGNGGAGGFYLSNILDHAINTPYYIRYWTTDGYYGNSTIIRPWTGGDPVPAVMTYNSFTLFRAGRPNPPTVAVGSFRLAYENDRWLPSFTASASPGTPNDTQIVSWQIRIGRVVSGAVDWDNPQQTRTYNSQSTSVTEDPASPFYNSTDTYRAIAAATNFFGSSDWTDPPVEFRIPPLEAPAGGGAIFAPVHHLTIRFVNNTTLGISWEVTGTTSAEIFWSQAGPDASYTSTGWTVSGTSNNNIAVAGLSNRTTYYRIVPVGRSPVGTATGDTPSETVAVVMRNLRRSGGFGINTLTFPFVPGTMRGTLGPITTAQQLVDEVNEQAGETRVTVFGWWDTENQRHDGAYFDSVQNQWRSVINNSAVDLSTLSLEPNRPYQISVNQPVNNFRLVGKL